MNATDCTQRGQVGVDIGFQTNVLYLIASPFSLFGTCWMLKTFARAPSLHEAFHLRIVASLTLADLGFTLKFFLSALVSLGKVTVFRTIGSWCCALVAAATSFFGLFVDDDTTCLHFFFVGLATNIWTFIIAFNVAFIVASPLTFLAWSKGNALFYVYSVLAWGSSLCFTLIGLLKPQSVSLLPDSSCWVQPIEQFGVYAAFLSFFAWSLLTVAYSMVKLSAGTGVRSTHVIRQMLLFLMAYMSVWIWGQILFLGGKATAAVSRASAISYCLNGFINYLVWRHRVLEKIGTLERRLLDTTGEEFSD